MTGALRNRLRRVAAVALATCAAMSIPAQEPPESAPRPDHNLLATRPTHAPRPELPPLAALAFVQAGNRAWTEAVAAARARGPRAPVERPKLRPRPAGAGRYVCAVLLCADCDVEVAPMLGLARRDVLVLQTPGPYAGPEHTALLERVVTRHRVPLVLVLGHADCESLRASADDGRPNDALDRRRATLLRYAKLHELKLEEALLRRQRELLLASSPKLQRRERDDDLRVVPGVVDPEAGRIDWRPRRAHALPLAPIK